MGSGRMRRNQNADVTKQSVLQYLQSVAVIGYFRQVQAHLRHWKKRCDQGWDMWDSGVKV